MKKHGKCKNAMYRKTKKKKAGEAGGCFHSPPSAPAAFPGFWDPRQKSRTNSASYTPQLPGQSPGCD